MKKKFVLLFCIISCMLVAAGCSLVRENKNFDKKSLEEQTDQFIQSWFAADFNGTMEAYKDQMDETTLAQYEEYAKLQEKYQGVEKKIKTEYTITTDSATVTETVLCNNGKKMLISLSFDENGNIQSDETGMYAFKFEEYKTMGQQMGKAGLNTVMSMAIVFTVLIFISLLISCFIFIGKIQGNKNAAAAKNAAVSAKASAPAPVQAVTAKENLVDDLELVAVITAAIAAANETESADGLVVRSIIRR